MAMRRRSSSIRIFGGVALAVGLVAAGCSSGSSDGGADGDTTTTAAPVELDDSIKLNEIQVMGTHNSFHVPGSDAEVSRLVALDADAAVERAYSHAPITEQLEEQKVRQLEFDVFVDTEGGAFADPVFGDGGVVDPALDEPGTKVLHEQDIDFGSVCPTLVACLTEVRDWSDANPDHVPVGISIQFKDGQLIFDVAGQTIPEKWTAEQMAAMEDEILSVFDRNQLVTPDDVRGEFGSLEEAVLAGNWPTLGDSRGKVLFTMINPEPYRGTYLGLYPNLEGALLFTNAAPGQPDASYVGLDDPVTDGDRITELVELGYLVRTRSDVPGPDRPTQSRLDAALASGAQWIATDHPGPDGASTQFDSDYVGELPGFAAARCNPVTAPDTCNDATLEQP